MNRAVKIRIYPNKEQKVQIEKTIGCSRFIYNQMLADKISYYQKEKKMLRNTPAGYKKEYPWLKGVDSLQPASSAWAGDGGRNSASAKDCGVLLERIYRGQCVSKQYSNEMLNLLLHQTVRYKIPAGLPSGVVCANKTGETSTVQHDIAIVYEKKTNYVLCVFSSGASESRLQAGIRAVSARVYEYMNK